MIKKYLFGILLMIQSAIAGENDAEKNAPESSMTYEDVCKCPEIADQKPSTKLTPVSGKFVNISGKKYQVRFFIYQDDKGQAADKSFGEFIKASQLDKTHGRMMHKSFGDIAFFRAPENIRAKGVNWVLALMEQGAKPSGKDLIEPQKPKVLRPSKITYGDLAKSSLFHLASSENVPEGAGSIVDFHDEKYEVRMLFFNASENAKYKSFKEVVENFDLAKMAGDVMNVGWGDLDVFYPSEELRKQGYTWKISLRKQ